MKRCAIATLLGSASISAACILLSGSAIAQDNDEGYFLGTILITGEKVERSLQDTASSVSVKTEEDIESNVSADSVATIIRDVPNVMYSGTVGAPTIRGQDAQGPNSGAGAFFGGTVPRATVNIDGHYLGYNELVFGAASLWDVESVEVFRGSQTTSQGANSIAGAMIVNTKDPTFTREGAYQLEYGTLNRRRASIAFSGPLSDQLAARVSLDYSGRDTFIDYVSPRYTQGITDLDFEHLSGRFKLLWRPTDIAGLEAKLTYSVTDTNRPTTEAAGLPFENLDSNTLTMPSWSQRTDTIIGDVSYEFGNNLKLINQIQYSDTSIRRVSEPMSFGGAFIDQHNISNETRLSFGTQDSPISGVVGIYVARTDSAEILFTRGTSQYDDQKDNLGLFVDVTYKFAERWTLNGGLRYQRDRVRRTGTSNFANSALNYDRTFDELLPKISLAYDVAPSTTIGVMVNKGYNPGGVSLNFRSREYAPFEAETVWNYEIFGRTQLLDDRLILTGNLFYSDFKNAQRYVQVSLPGIVGQSLTVNAEAARSYGLELGLDYQARDNLRLTAGVGLLETEITRFTSAQADFLGKDFTNSPGYMLSLGVDWDISPKLNLGGSLRITDSYYSSDDNNAAFAVDRYAVANMQMTYKPRDNFEIYGYVNNIFDERAPTFKRNNRSAGGIEADMLEPRTIGIGIRSTF